MSDADYREIERVALAGDVEASKVAQLMKCRVGDHQWEQFGVLQRQPEMGYLQRAFNQRICFECGRTQYSKDGLWWVP